MFLTQVNKLLKSFKFFFILVVVYYLFTSSIYSIASLVKHSHYDTSQDLAVFNQGIWQYSQFKFPFMSLHLNRPFLGDHFHPILITLAPLYWIYPSEKILLFIQPFIILSTLIPLFLISSKLTKSAFFSLSIVFAYSLYIPLQYAIFYDFHEIIFLPPLFAWAYYFYCLDKKTVCNIFLFLLLFVKEEVGFFIAAFGLYLLLFNKKWRINGFLWGVIGICYSLIMMYVVIPKIGGNYLYFNYGNSGHTPLEVITNFLKDPVSFLKLFFDSPVKNETLYRTFWPFAFLPLISPMGLILSIEQFFSRFVDLRTISRWTIGYHYSVPISIVVALGTIWSVNFYSKFFPSRKKILILVGILIIMLTRLEQINASAILLIKRPIFWQRDSWMDDIDKAISLLPKEASVATQNNIAPHVSTRTKVYFLKDIDKAEYILVDFHPGQSDYNFYSKEEKEISKKNINEKISSNKYQIIYNHGDISLIKKI